MEPLQLQRQYEVPFVPSYCIYIFYVSTYKLTLINNGHDGLQWGIAIRYELGSSTQPPVVYWSWLDSFDREF